MPERSLPDLEEVYQLKKKLVRLRRSLPAKEEACQTYVEEACQS